MVVTNELKDAPLATAPVALNTLSVNVLTAPGKTVVGERPARRMFPGQVATKLVSPEPYEHDRFTLEGHELRIIEQGRTDSPDSTSLYVPSIGLIAAGDVVYNRCRVYVGDTNSGNATTRPSAGI